MKFLDTFSLATRMFKNRPMRTTLTILGVSVGIGTVLFLVSFGYGLQNTILNRITTADSLLSLDISSGSSGLLHLDNENVDNFYKIEGVSEVSRFSSFSGQMSINGLVGDGLIYAVDSSFFRLGGINLDNGKYFEDIDTQGLVISSAAAQLFDINPSDIIGREINLTLFVTRLNDDGFEEADIVRRDQPFVVRGLIRDENTSYVFVNLKSFDDLNVNSYDQLKVKVGNSDNIESISNIIIEQGFLVSSLSDTIDQANKIFSIVQIVLLSFGFVALLVSAIGMFNTMTIALLERINEIGIMRSIGITKKDIMKVFLLESVIMGFLGGVGGILIGFIGGQAVNWGINLLASSFGGQALDLFYSPLWFVLMVAFFSSVVGFLTGIYPSLKASKLNPLDALRYK